MRKYSVNVEANLPVLMDVDGFAGHLGACEKLRALLEGMGAENIRFGGSWGEEAKDGDRDALGNVFPPATAALLNKIEEAKED